MFLFYYCYILYYIYIILYTLYYIYYYYNTLTDHQKLLLWFRKCLKRKVTKQFVQFARKPLAFNMMCQYDYLFAPQHLKMILITFLFNIFKNKGKNKQYPSILFQCWMLDQWWSILEFWESSMLDARSRMIDTRGLGIKHARTRSMLATQYSYSLDARKKSTRPITNMWGSCLHKVYSR